MSCHILPNAMSLCANCIEQTPHGKWENLTMENKNAKKDWTDNKAAGTTTPKAGAKPIVNTVQAPQKPAPKGGAKPTKPGR